MSWDVTEKDPAEVLATMLRPFPHRSYVCLVLAGDHYLWFSENAFGFDLLVACRVAISGGPGAVVADSPDPEMVAAYRRSYGEFGASYEVERWYAPFGGARRRILARLLPDRSGCLEIAPPLPPDYVAPRTWEEVRARSRPLPSPAPVPGPVARRKVAAGQLGLFD